LQAFPVRDKGSYGCPFHSRSDHGNFLPWQRIFGYYDKFSNIASGVTVQFRL